MDLVSVIGVIFVVLKLTGLITWAWMYVLIPFYPAVVALLAIFIIAVWNSSK